jgi:hypothetical protein
VAHRSANAVIYWNLDDEYIGSTKGFQWNGIEPEPGKHLLTLIDQQGDRLRAIFRCFEKDTKWKTLWRFLCVYSAISAISFFYFEPRHIN